MKLGYACINLTLGRTFRTFLSHIYMSAYDVMLECKAKERALLKLRAENI